MAFTTRKRSPSGGARRWPVVGARRRIDALGGRHRCVGEIAGRLSVLACAASVSAGEPFRPDLEVELESDSSQAGIRALELEAVSLARERDEIQRLAEHRERELVSTLERMHDVERAMAGVAAREGDLRELVVDAQDQLIQRDEALNDALAQRDALEREVRELRVRLDRIHSLKPFALYRWLRGLPVLRTLEARRISRRADAIRRSGG